MLKSQLTQKVLEDVGAADQREEEAIDGAPVKQIMLTRQVIAMRMMVIILGKIKAKVL